MRLYLVRHGRTSWNVQGRLQGHTDIALDDVGEDQAQMVGEAFRHVQIDRIISSDLIRAVATANAISATTQAPVHHRTDLRERCFGDWEGKDVREVAAFTLEASLAQGVSTTFVRPPNGESHADLFDRVTQVVSDLEDTDERLVVVAHGGSTAAILARLMRGTPETVRAFRFGNTSITELERRGDGNYTMLRYSDIQHLSPTSSPRESVDASRK